VKAIALNIRCGLKWKAHLQADHIKAMLARGYNQAEEKCRRKKAGQ
jgi:hypothetical protein